MEMNKEKRKKYLKENLFWLVVLKWILIIEVIFGITAIADKNKILIFIALTLGVAVCFALLIEVVPSVQIEIKDRLNRLSKGNK